jgi:hypothetical protein
MIPVTLAPVPPTFNQSVREPGLRAIAEMVGKPHAYPRRKGKAFKKIADHEDDIPSERFEPYWTAALADLMKAYNRVCAYSCFAIHPVTGARSVDHFAPKSRRWDRVYEWDNYRLCCSLLNSRKRDFGDVLDPCTIHPDWFQLELLAFQVIPNPQLNEKERKSVQDTIDRLGLDDFRSEREEDAELYWKRDCSLRVLKRESPFVAHELHRQGRLNPGDVW